MSDEDWRDRALCAGTAPLTADAPDPWFDFDHEADSDAVAWEARLTCARCPVRRECLTSAFESQHSLNYGIYGGTLPLERRQWADRAQRMEILLEDVELYAARMAPLLFTITDSEVA